MAGLAMLAFPLFLSLLAVIQPINITYVEGLPDDFSGMVIEAVTGNSTYDVPYETIEKHDGEWILVNATLPEENYTLNVLSSSFASSPDASQTPELYIADVPYQEGLLPDFSNLIVSYESAGSPPVEIPYSFIGVEPGTWAAIALERAPLDGESVIFAAHVEVLPPSGNETGAVPQEPEAGTPETPSEPANETIPPAEGNETGLPENGTAMNETPDTVIPEPELELNQTPAVEIPESEPVLNETGGGIYVSDDSENSTLLIPGNYTIEAINETSETISLYATLDSPADLTGETPAPAANGKSGPPDIPPGWGDPANQTFQIHGSKNRSSAANITLSRGGSEVSFTIGKGKNVIGIPHGRYGVKVKSDENLTEDKGGRPFAPVEEITLSNVDMSAGEGFDLGLEYLSPNEIPFGKSARQAYAIDPTNVTFDSGEVSVRAKGTELYKCAEWDFESQVCLGSWEKLMDIVPGEIYTIQIGPDDPAYAEYNTTYGAPRCGNYSSPCYANSSLLRSRDSLATPEPNQPNTLDSCADGTLGIYLFDESVENITITGLNGTSFNAGDTVNVTAAVHCWDGLSDNVNFLYTSSASSPSWTTIGYTNPCPASGINTITKTFRLDDVGGEHAVRVIIQFLGDNADTCGAGLYDDTDDLAFLVNGTETPQPGDAIIAYRSNTGLFGTNSPKIRFWNASGSGQWGREIELQTAGSPVRYARAAWSPISSKIAVVTLSDDGSLDGYVCMANCSRPGSWSYASNIGNVWLLAPGTSSRRFDIAFESSTGDLMLAYSIYSINAARDWAYQVLPAGTSSFSGLSEQYINDAGHGTDLTYSWLRMDSKPGNNRELSLISIDTTDNDINSWIWNGTAWGNQASITNTAPSTSGFEALAVRYAADKSIALALGGDGTTGNVSWRYWNGSAWSAAAIFDVDAADANDVRWASLKADPASDDLQAVFVDSGSDLTTAYWNGSAWAVTTGIDNAIDSAVARPADFEWNLTGSVGRLVWDTDGAGTTLSQRPCSPQCTGTTATTSAYSGTGAWVTMWRNPSSSGNVRILSARLNSNFDIGSFTFSNASAFSNYGDSAITADTAVSTFESYSIAFNMSDATPPFINFTAPTPPNNTVIYADYAFINVTVTDNLEVGTVTLEWNGTNQTINFTSGTEWGVNMTGLVPGAYAYRVFANDISGNLNVSETRRLVYGSRPGVIVLDPQGGTYDQHSFIPIAINATDSDNISKAIATITLPDSTQENVTLVISPPGDNFNYDTVGIAWFVENWSISASQACVADINGTVPGKAFTSLSGDGSPYSDTYCSLVTIHPLYGDFDLNVSFDILASDGVDNAINFKLTEDRTSFSSKQAFMSLGNWTGEGRTYDIFVDDGSASGYILTRDTDDTTGKFRITRSGDNFTFYIWNNTDSTWTLENSSVLNLSKVLFITMESESAYSGWGTMNVTWDNLTIIKSPYYVGSFNDTEQIGLYNITFFVNDTLNAVNDSEKANFTIAQINHGPTVPFILAPTIGQNVFGMFNITWSTVSDEENDTIQFNITLLNPDGSDNASIAADYGNVSSNNYLWNTSMFPDGNYSMRIVAYENATAELLSSSNTLAGTFQINNSPNTPPSVIILSPLGESHYQGAAVSLSISASDSDGIAAAIAQVTYPNGSLANITLHSGQHSDAFSNDTVGTSWHIEDALTGPSQACIADIDTSYPGMAYTSLSGNGAPESDTLCSLIADKPIDGDFDISISFNMTGGVLGTDSAINFQALEGNSSAEARELVFIALSNWTGLGMNYEVFVSGENYSDYILRRPTNDTYGKFRITRSGTNFTFYTWNNTGSSWAYENSTDLDICRPLYPSFESESATPGWGNASAAWDDLVIIDNNATFAAFSDTLSLGLYNVTFFVNDTRGGMNDSEKTNFTVFFQNQAPSKPIIIVPTPGMVLSGATNISWSGVFDLENDTLLFNITLLNPDGSDNSTIVSDYGNASSTDYLWNTTAYQDGEYSVRVTVYENETAEGLGNSYVVPGTFFINNNVPSVIAISPLGGTYPDNVPLPIVINATDSDGIDTAIATIHHSVTNTTENITLYPASTGDNFSADNTGSGWFVENSSIGPSQACVADINGTVPGKAFTSLSGDGSPLSDTYCSFISGNIIYGDFDLNVSFDILASDGVDNAINFKLTEGNSSFSSLQAFMSLGNWTGEGRTYDVFVDDGSTSGYILTRDTDDTTGKFRITRSGDNFTFYTWNNTDSSWTFENSSTLNLSNALFMTMESESAYSGWGTMNVTWDDLSISSNPYYSNVFYDPGHYAVLHNVTFFVNDTRGGVNDTEITNFTLYNANNRPTTPFLLNPTPGLAVSGFVNITWSSVTDLDNDTLRFNITLLNSDGSDNATIISDYGNASATKFLWDTSAYPDGEYSMRVTVYENETADGLDNSYTLAGTFFINNGIPSVIVIAPLGETSGDCMPVSLSINASDSGGIDTAIATVTLPDSSSANITLDGGQVSDDFSVDSVGTNWTEESILVGSSQTCIADIDTSVLGMAYTSLEGPDGLPFTDTLCSLVSGKAIDGDFDISIDFNITGETIIDHALNFQVMEVPSSADASKLIFMSLSHFTGFNQTYDIFVDDGNISEYLLQRDNNDSSGRFRIVRQGGNFTFYTWNNSASAWNQEIVSYSQYNLSRALYVTFESESAYPGWGTMNVTWDNFTVIDSNNTFAMFTDTCQVGLYNVSFYVNDTQGAANGTEETNFTIVDINNPPSSPFILTPPPGEVISGLYNITGTQVFDPENDSLRINITLLNPDYSYNSSIVSDFGNDSTTSYEWDTTTVPDGVYSLEIVFYENETPEGLSSSDTLIGNFTVDNNAPTIQFEPPTEASGSSIGRDYIMVNVSAIDITLNQIEIRLYNSSGDLINTSDQSSSPAFANFSGLPDGLYFFNATALDVLGRTNSTETRNVTIRASCPIINVSGEYYPIGNYYGSPNPAGAPGGYACVLITASDVLFDCMGFNITGNSNGTTYGILIDGAASNVTVRNCTSVSNYTDGVFAFNSSGVVVADLTSSGNGIGILVANSSSANVSGANSTNNSNAGFLLDASSESNLSGNSFCQNALDVDNQGGSVPASSLDRCDSFLNWSENGHLGCEYSCSDLWHRFFGNASGTIVLGNNTTYVYSWNASAFNMYFADADSVIGWQALQAIGRDTSNASSSDDFTELDTAFGTSAFADNITSTFSSDGTAPLSTENYTVYGREIADVPVANSTSFNTTFRTGILWDTGDGGTEYGNAFNQSTVWAVKVNSSTADTYGTYDFLGQIPYSLSTREGANDVISVYVELK